VVFIFGPIDDSRAPPTGLEVEKPAAKMVNILKHIVKNDAMKKLVELVTAGRATVLTFAGSDPVEIYGWRVFALGRFCAYFSGSLPFPLPSKHSIP
jgi:hypothetical protein